MKNVLLLYKSNTGFTKKYAKWIQEKLDCSTMPIEKTDVNKMKKYDVIIFGGGMHANKINGIKYIHQNLHQLEDKKLIIFATGATPSSAVDQVSKFKESNIPSESSIEFFYFQSGMNYKEMRINDRLMMNCLKLALKVKKDKNAVEQGAKEAIISSYDNSDRTQIEPLISYVKELSV